MKLSQTHSRHSNVSLLRLFLLRKDSHSLGTLALRLTLIVISESPYPLNIYIAHLM